LNIIQSYLSADVCEDLGLAGIGLDSSQVIIRDTLNAWMEAFWVFTEEKHKEYTRLGVQQTATLPMT